MKWFNHFTSAHGNSDLTKVRMKYDANGYVIYRYCLELFSGDLGIKRSIKLEIPTLVYCTCHMAKSCDRNSGPMRFDPVLDGRLANPLGRVTK